MIVREGPIAVYDLWEGPVTVCDLWEGPVTVCDLNFKVYTVIRDLVLKFVVKLKLVVFIWSSDEKDFLHGTSRKDIDEQ